MRASWSSHCSSDSGIERRHGGGGGGKLASSVSTSCSAAASESDTATGRLFPVGERRKRVDRAGFLSVVLNETRPSRPKPRPVFFGFGTSRGRHYNFQTEVVAKFRTQCRVETFGRETATGAETNRRDRSFGLESGLHSCSPRDRSRPKFHILGLGLEALVSAVFETDQ